MNDINLEEAILNSATKLFLKNGFSATSTTDIARDAGCNQALVHYYYRTKDRLFDAIFQTKLKSFIESLLHIGQEDLPFRQKIAKRIEAHFDTIQKDPMLPMFIFREVSFNPGRLKLLKESLKNLPQQMLAQMQKELDEEISHGRIRRISVHDLLLTIISLNIMVFMVEPIFKTVMGVSDEAFEALRQQRKKEHIHLVMCSLNP
jgi:TetR/AcrR family transcriptional regulator